MHSLINDYILVSKKKVFVPSCRIQTGIALLDLYWLYCGPLWSVVVRCGPLWSFVVIFTKID